MYLLHNDAAERERLRLQATVWEPDAAAMFVEIGPVETAIDLGCGAMGVLRPLSKIAKRVVGIDADAALVDAARGFVAEERLGNVEVQVADLFANDLPAFDLVHARFLFAPLGRDREILDAALRLCKPGGVIAIEEPDSASWGMLPPSPGFDELKAEILAAFRRNGGDFDAGRRTHAMLRERGVRDLRVRAAIHALPAGHPYGRLPLAFASSLRIARPELLARVEAELDAPALTFALTQVWGVTPRATS